MSLPPKRYECPLCKAEEKRLIFPDIFSLTSEQGRGRIFFNKGFVSSIYVFVSGDFILKGLIMVTNKILDQAGQGKKALGLDLRFPSELLVEVAGRMGMDFVWFDGQHTALTLAVVERLCRVADGFGITPAMRIPDQQESTILRFLDAGMKTIIVPNLQTREQAEALVKHSYYGPKGLRSATGLRVVLNAQSDDLIYTYKVTNENTMIVPQLESAIAFENLDEILKVDGIDYFTGGPQDIAQSMGLPGQANHPKVREAFTEAVDKVRAAGKKMFSDVTVSVNALSVIIGAGRELLEKHGRECKLPWSG